MRQLALDYTGAVLTADSDDLAILKNRGPRFLRGWLRVKHRGADLRSVERLIQAAILKLHR